MKLKGLECFLAVAEAGNFTRAAERMFLTQSALSEQVARLESEIGSQLFVRARRAVRLTVAGEALRPIAQRIVADVELAEQEMAGIRGMLVGKLRIGMIEGVPAGVDLIGLIAAFHERHRSLQLEVHTGASRDLVDGVLTGALDVSIVGLPKSELPAALNLEPIVDDPLMAVFARDARRGAIRPIAPHELLDRGPFIHYRRSSGLRFGVEAALKRAGADVVAPFELDQISDMIRLASLGVGSTIVPASSAGTAGPRSLDGHRYVVAPLSDERAMLHIGVATPGSPSPPAIAFVELLRARGRPPTTIAFRDRRQA